MIRRFARPYARAIIDLLPKPHEANALLGELRQFETARLSSADLQELFANPGIDADTKLKIIAQLGSRMKLSPMAVKVLEVLIRNHRANDLGAINEALAATINAQLGVVVAEVRSAHRLADDEVQQLRETLERKVGKKVNLELTTDPTLLGGFVAKIGSEIWNASVSGKIDKFRASLDSPF